MPNEKQSLPCRNLCCGPLFLLHIFLRFFLLLLLHNSGNLAIPHDHLFLCLNILHLFLFKSLQSQGELSISGRADLPFVRNGFFAIYFRPSVSKIYPSRALIMQQGLRRYWWQVKTILLYMALYGCFCCLGRYWTVPLTLEMGIWCAM